MEREVILVPLLHAEVSLLANIPHLWRSVVKAQVCSWDVKRLSILC